MIKIFRPLALALIPVLAVATGQAASASGDNPMWASGYKWKCNIYSRVLCERSTGCRPAKVVTDALIIDFQNSSVSIGNRATPVRRHYAQTIVGSPLQAEVKIELADNTVLWLNAVDGSLVYSDAWIGSLIRQKSGVVLSETQSLSCNPV